FMFRSRIRRQFTLALAVAGLLAVSGGADAYYYGRPGYVSSGSVRYSSYGGAAGRTTNTTAAGGSVRYGSAGYGNTMGRATAIGTTYDRDYIGRFPSGYKTMPGAGGKSYAYYPRLPQGAQPATIGGNRYYVHNGV